MKVDLQPYPEGKIRSNDHLQKLVFFDVAQTINCKIRTC
jgi:hypothetical protein